MTVVSAAPVEETPVEPPLDMEALKSFKFERVLSENTSSGMMYLLGTLHDLPAILHIQRTAFSSESAPDLVKEGLEALDVFLDNRPYFSAHANLKPTTTPDLSLKFIWPATEVHVGKYTAQERVMVTETPELYEKVVVPYIEAFPASRIDWVFNILDGKKEAERILYRDAHPEKGFVILPDLKWDQTSMAALVINRADSKQYLTVIVQTRSIRCLRDLTPAHLPLLNDIKNKVYTTVQEKFDVAKESLRLFVHYQPSYYHFHVHVVHIKHEATAGMTVGQAHLLDDLITLLELTPPAPAPSILAKMTLTYALGVEHGLYPALSGKVTNSAAE